MELKNKQSNKDWFESLFQEYSDVIYRLCLYKTSDKNVANDLTQNTFLKLWKAICDDKEIEKPKQYIYQISRNLIVDYYKSKKAVSLDYMQENGFDPKSKEISPEDVAEVSLLRDAIDCLDEDFREVLYLRFVEGLGVNQISDMLGISENLVSVRINRGKTKLKEKFE